MLASGLPKHAQQHRYLGRGITADFRARRLNMSMVSCHFERSQASNSSKMRSRKSCTPRMLNREIQSFAQTADTNPSLPVRSDSCFDSKPPGGSKQTARTRSEKSRPAPRSISANTVAKPAPRLWPVMTTLQPWARPPGASASSSAPASSSRSKQSLAQAITVECAKKSVSSSKGPSLEASSPAMPKGSKKAGSARRSAMQSLMSMVPRIATTKVHLAWSNTAANGGAESGPRFSQVPQSNSDSFSPCRSACSLSKRLKAS
mmetsp:Transcript_66369/g.215920  ORF Transcript_66369/g.215920 Transcript_66369/m.215920 type:complete len:261 (+) Transcript_66369:456-1238(+)